MILLPKTSLSRFAPATVVNLAGVWLLVFRRAQEQDIFKLIWILVFGFATLNILGMAARQNEINRKRLNFGEILSIVIVVVAIVLLSWEMLNFFHVLPIKFKF